jgi:hypothetical protein
MKTVFATLFLFLNGCMAASTGSVWVCSANTCATGWYHTDGTVKTASHAFLQGTDVEIKTELGYSDRGVVASHDGLDTATIVAEPYKTKACYESVEIGEFVRILVYKGMASGRISGIREGGDYYIIDSDGIMLGDSGSPVINKRGCIIGQVMGLLDGSVIVVKTPMN